MNIIPQAKHICGPIGYAPYAIPGGEDLGKKIAAEFSKGFNAVIMENHGTVVGGSDVPAEPTSRNYGRGTIYWGGALSESDAANYALDPSQKILSK